ncbi:MAG: NACHT domain-containing protein [Trebonia sp.]
MLQGSGKTRAIFGFTILMAIIFVISLLLRAQSAVNVATVAATLISATALYLMLAGEPTEEKIESAILELAAALEVNWGSRMALLLGRDTHLPTANQPRAANLAFFRMTGLELANEPHLEASGNWETIYERFYKHISTGRLVIVGEPGYGKTLLAIQLVLQILHARTKVDPPGKKLPVPVSVAGWDGDEDLPTWLAKRLKEEWHLSPAIGRALIRRHLILPVLDGLDEVGARRDENERLKRQLSVLRRLNSSYGATRGNQPVPIIMTCRTEDYRPLRKAEGGLVNAAVVAVQPLNRILVMNYLSTRFDPARTVHSTDGAQWLEFVRKVGDGPEGNLEKCLQSPWFLSLAISACRAGEATVVQLEKFQDLAILEGFLTASSISAATQLHPRGVRTLDSVAKEETRQKRLEGPDSQYDPEEVRMWLTTLADHLDWQARNGLSSTSIDLLTFWRVAEAKGDYPRLIHTCIGVFGGILAGTLGGEFGDGVVGLTIMTFTVAGGIGFGLWAGLRRNPQPSRVTLPQVSDSRGRIVISLAIIIALLGGIGGYLIGRSAAIGVSEGVSAGFATLVSAGLGDSRVKVLQPRDALRTDLGFGVTLGIVYVALGGLPGGLTGGILSHLHLNRYLTVPGSIALALVVGLIAGVSLGARSWLRYMITIGLEARKGRLPWRFETFMDWAYGAGLLRLTGVSYQFRHDKLKISLESNEAE